MRKEIAKMISGVFAFCLVGWMFMFIIHTVSTMIKINTKTYNEVCIYTKTRLDYVIPSTALSCWLMEPVDQEDK